MPPLLIFAQPRGNMLTWRIVQRRLLSFCRPWKPMGYSGSSEPESTLTFEKLYAHLCIEEIMFLLVEQRDVDMAPLIFEGFRPRSSIL
jgi:hypothetical protein